MTIGKEWEFQLIKGQDSGDENNENILNLIQGKYAEIISKFLLKVSQKSVFKQIIVSTSNQSIVSTSNQIIVSTSNQSIVSTLLER